MDTSVGEHPRTPSELEEVKEEFIAKNFSKRAMFWEDLALFVKAELDKHLKQQDPVVHSTSTYRVKTKESLRGKVERLQKQGKCQDLASFENVRWDTAGVRVCLYFPCQKSQVKTFIESHELFEVVPASSEQPARVFSERGYRMKNPETRPYDERMGYYEADHYSIRLRRDPFEGARVKGYYNEQVEIQVRTVLMDAWAEIRHDLDYKHILGSATGEELRVLDAIKGSIMSCEILQDHLFILRKQHVESDAERWTRESSKRTRISILNTMSFEPGMRFLLDRFGSEPSEGALFRYTKELFERCDIHSLLEFRQTMARLIRIDEQPEKATKAQWALSSMYSSSQYRGTQKKDALEDDTLMLFQFVSILLLYAMDVEDIERRLWAPKYDSVDDDEEDEEDELDTSDTDEDDSDETGDDTGDTASDLSNNSEGNSDDKSEIEDDEDNEDDKSEDSNDNDDDDDDDDDDDRDSDFDIDNIWGPDRKKGRTSPKIWSKERLARKPDRWTKRAYERRAARWYSLLSMVLDTMDNCRPDVLHEAMPRWLHTVSITWHVHEWVATIYQDKAKLTDVMPVVARLFRYFKAHIEDAWNGEATWLYTIATYLQWWEKHKVWLYTEDQRDWEIRRKYGMTVDKEMLMDDGWIKASQVAADIIGVAPVHLKHAALFRALLRGRHADDYAHLHLHNEDIDINCQDSCGNSFLGAAAAFGSEDICRMMLTRPGANLNLAFSDGLSLMHIAVVRENGAMIKQLASSLNLDTKATWDVEDLSFAKNNRKAKPRAPYWSQYDKRENWRPKSHKGKKSRGSLKMAWTAVEMAKRRCRENADLQSLYEPLFDAARHAHDKKPSLTKRSRKRRG